MLAIYLFLIESCSLIFFIIVIKKRIEYYKYTAKFVLNPVFYFSLIDWKYFRILSKKIVVSRIFRVHPYLSRATFYRCGMQLKPIR